VGPVAVLGFQLKNLGDALMCLPALALIKEREPGARTALLVRPQVLPLMEGQPSVDRALSWDYRSSSLGLNAALGLSRAIREGSYSLALGFDHKRRSGLMAFLSGLRERQASPLWGYESPAWPWRLSPSGERQDRGLAQRLEAELELSRRRHVALSQVYLAAQALGWDRASLAPGLIRPRHPPIAEPVMAKARELMESIPGSGPGPLIALALRGRQPEKSWPLPKVAGTVRLLAERKGARFFLTGEARDRELLPALERLSGARIGDLCGKTGLMEFLAVLKLASLLISVDTGAGHICALTETPVLAVFTATNPAQWAPLAARSRILCYNQALARFGLGPKDFRHWPEVGEREASAAALELLEGGE
jgi:ADP-heptose:LPS heptosyltransferase